MAFARQEKAASDTPRLFDINFHKIPNWKIHIERKKKMKMTSHNHTISTKVTQRIRKTMFAHTYTAEAVKAPRL